MKGKLAVSVIDIESRAGKAIDSLNISRLFGRMRRKENI
jgi:hypothetical protein